jgi:uncharacterized phage infection (PIP) family protein YhgE
MGYIINVYLGLNYLNEFASEVGMSSAELNSLLISNVITTSIIGIVLCIGGAFVGSALQERKKESFS